MLNSFQHPFLHRPALSRKGLGTSSGRRDGRQAKSWGEINPLWIVTLNEIDLPLSVPPLELPLAIYGVVHRFELLEAIKLMDGVSGGKSLHVPSAVLVKARNQVRGDANV